MLVRSCSNMGRETNNLFPILCTYIILIGLNELTSVQGQYLYKGVKGPAPVADETNPFVYDATEKVVDIPEVIYSSPYRSDTYQQRNQQSLPPGFFATETFSSATSKPYVPAPVYGPPGTEDLTKSEEFGDFYIFVPAFPSSSLAQENEQFGAAPAPGGTANAGFIPPDGALLGPPAPIVDGTPLPSPRIASHRAHRTRPLYPHLHYHR